MSASFSQASIAEKVEAHAASGGRAVIYFGSHKVTVGPGTRVDGQLLHGVVGESNEEILIELAQVSGAQLLAAPEERQVGFGAP
ncbi:hypothetical protein LWE61_16315 [Sphingobium sufflavum]|uniref:hypothetical protein n=1 Tax=Sphingobium sufflavum TaxID=1129547 RepID=UPI001F492BC0|nr:hypothetical protein [Sphingobium sufflavum]MCE7798110.1 hypothetical protein [Sphingobium sufflavum]